MKASDRAPCGQPPVTLQRLSVHYRKACALQDVSGHFARGSLTAVVGRNGSGKSTLLKSIAGRLPAHAVCSAQGVRLALPLQKMAYLAQRSELDPRFPISVLDCTLQGYWQQVGAFGRITADMQARAQQALHTVGLAGAGPHRLEALSVGQLQRVLFARLLLQDAELILLDEPFSAVDAQTTDDLLALLQLWQQQGRTVIAVLHDAQQVERYFSHTLVLNGKAVSWGERTPTQGMTLQVAA